jgi:hypothetical protein
VGRADVLIQLTEGGAIEGVVRDPGKALSSTLVAVSRGDGRAFQQHVGVDGRFRFEGLIPGLWNVEALEREPESRRARLGVQPGERELPSVCEVFPGQTTYHDLRLSEHVLKGVLEVNGAPAAGWRARLQPVLIQRPASERATVLLDAQGRFEVSLPVECKAQLSLEPPGSESAVTLRARIELAGERTEWNFALETGRMIVSGVPEVTGFFEAPFLYWQGPNDVHAIKRLEPDAHQQSVLEGVPAGEVRILRYLDPEGPWTERSPSETLAVARVPERGTAFVRLP